MTTYFSRFLRNTKLTWNKEASMVIQRLHHSSATAVPSIFQIYFKSLCFSISSAISSVQGSVTPHLEYCYFLVLYIVYSFNTCELSVWHVSGTESGQEGWLREKLKKKKKNKVHGVELDVHSPKTTDTAPWQGKGKGGGGTSPVKVTWWQCHR